jgi:hypothetical protein
MKQYLPIAVHQKIRCVAPGRLIELSLIMTNIVLYSGREQDQFWGRIDAAVVAGGSPC